MKILVCFTLTFLCLLAWPQSSLADSGQSAELNQLLAETLAKDEYQPRESESSYSKKIKAYVAAKLRDIRDSFRSFVDDLPTPNISMPQAFLNLFLGLGTIFTFIFYILLGSLILYICYKLSRVILRLITKIEDKEEDALVLESSEVLKFPKVSADISGLVALHKFSRATLLRERKLAPSTTDRELVANGSSDSKPATLFDSLVKLFELAVYRGEALDLETFANLSSDYQKIYGSKR